MDVIIVGAGIIGSSIAWRLAQRGATVTLIDQGKMGGQASHAGAGMLAPGGEFTEQSPWAKIAVLSLTQYPEFIRELKEASGLPIDFRICGALEFAASPAAWDDLNKKAAQQAALGIPSTPISHSAASKLAPLAATANFAAVRHYPDEAEVDPRNVMNALRKILLAQGVVIVEQQHVAALKAEGKGIMVGHRLADAAVLAAGAWSSQIQLPFSATLPLSLPVKGHLLGYHLSAGSLGPILRNGHTYILQRQSGYTIAGATTENAGFDPSIDPDAGDQIAANAQKLLPALEQSGKPDLWNGIRPGIASAQPQVGQIGDLPIWTAYGHYRNGILLAPTTAQTIAQSIRP